jgi:hypothetical protein
MEREGALGFRFDSGMESEGPKRIANMWDL